MITFNNLGYMGRLGNQMFQYAALKGIATYKKYQYSLPLHNFELKNCFNLPQTTALNSNTTTIFTDKFEFDKNFYENCPDNVDIAGFFQTKKYFQHIERQLRDDFVFKEDIFKTCVNYFKKINLSLPRVSLHIRRTDYLTDSNFFNLNINYYVEALKHFNNNLPVVIFSDDPEWCIQQDLFRKNYRFIVSGLKDPYLDLCAMSMCDYHIIANSSFSWWGSWLANSKKTIAPKQWFSGNYKDWNTKDLYLNNWIII